MINKLNAAFVISCISIIINFNLFVAPWLGFISSCLLLFAFNFFVLQATSFLISKFKLHVHASETAIIVLLLVLSLYGYGILKFPYWIAKGNLLLIRNEHWRTEQQTLFKQLFSGAVILLTLISYVIAKQEWGLKFIHRFLLIFLITVLTNRVWSYANTYLQYQPTQSIPISTSTNPAKPDIVYVVLDNLSGNEGLQKYWSFNNQPFIDTVENLGLLVGKNCSTHTNATIGVMSSVFNLSAYKNPAICNSNMDWIVKNEIINNSLFQLLHHNQYNLSTNSIFFDDKPYFFAESDIEPQWRFFHNVITRHFVFRLIKKTIGQFQTTRFDEKDWFYQYDKSTFDGWDNFLKQSPVKQPQFLYSHWLISHPIYRYDSTGRRTPSNDYIQQVKYQNNQLYKYLNLTIKKYHSLNKPLVILIHSDHGSRENGKPEEDSNIQIMLYDNTGKIKRIPEGSNPMNMMREILSTHLDLKLAPIQINYTHF